MKVSTEICDQLHKGFDPNVKVLSANFNSINHRYRHYDRNWSDSNAKENA